MAPHTINTTAAYRQLHKRVIIQQCYFYNKKLIRRWDSERELSLRRHRARTIKYNRLVHKFRHRSTRSAQKANEFGEITQPLGLLCRSRSFKVIEFGTIRKPICDFLLVINSNLPPIFHRFRDIASERSKIATISHQTLV